MLLLEEKEERGSPLVEREGVAEGEVALQQERELDAPLPLPLSSTTALLKGPNG
jgi:hypothetical protein